MDQENRNDAFILDEWLIQPELNRIVRGEEIVKIDPRNMRLLQLLASRPRQVIPQTEIERTVWSDVVVTPNSVYQSIAQLRRALGDERANPRYIETIARKGYRLITEVSAPRERMPTAAHMSTRDHSRLLRNVSRTSLALCLIVLTLIATFEFQAESSDNAQHSNASDPPPEFLLASNHVPKSPHIRSNVLAEMSLAASEDGRPKDARAYAEQAVELERRVSGDNSLDTAERLAVLALTQHWLAAYEDAEQNAREAVSIFESIQPTHPSKVDALNYLGNILADRGKFDEANSYLEQAVNLADHLYGESSGRGAASRSNLVTLYYLEGRYEESESLARRLLLNEALGRSYRTLEVRVRTELGHSLLAQRRYHEAKLEAEFALQVVSEVMRDDHPYSASVHDLLGRSFLGLEEYDRAEVAFREAIRIWRQNGGWTWREGRSASGLGEALLGQKRIPEAQQYLAYASRALDDIPDGQLELQAMRDHLARLEKLEIALQDYRFQRGQAEDPLRP